MELYQYLFRSVNSGFDSVRQLIAFYVFFILVLVLAVILGDSSLEGDHPGYNLYDCKRSTMACNSLFHYQINSSFGYKLIFKGSKFHA